MARENFFMEVVSVKTGEIEYVNPTEITHFRKVMDKEGKPTDHCEMVFTSGDTASFKISAAAFFELGQRRGVIYNVK